VLSGLRPFTKAKQVHAAAATLKLDGYQGAAKKPGKHMAFLAFETTEARDAALSALPDKATDLQKLFKSTSRVSAKEAGSGVSRRGLVGPGAKRPRDDGGASAAKRARTSSSEPEAPRTVHSATTPLLGLPYSAQLMRKQEQTVRMSVRLVRSIRNASLRAIKKAMSKGSAEDVAEAASKTSSAGYRRMPPEYLPVELWERATWVAPGLGVSSAPSQSPAAAAVPEGAAAPAASAADTPAAATGDADGADDDADTALPLPDAHAAAVARVLGAPAASLGHAGYLGSLPGPFHHLACSGRLLCAPIVPSPALLGFRNKVNFTIGRPQDDGPAEPAAKVPPAAPAPDAAASSSSSSSSAAVAPDAAASSSSSSSSAAVATEAAAGASSSSPATAAPVASPSAGLVVGFRVSSFAEGSAVAGCAPSAVTPAAAKAAAQVTEDVLRSSGVGAHSKAGDGEGAWRMLTVRVSEATDDVMLVLEVAADDDVVDAVAAAIAADPSARPGEDDVVAVTPGAPLPACLAALPPAVAAGLLGWRDAVLASPLEVRRPGALPTTEADGMPAVPSGLVGGGNDLRVTSACGSLLLQSAGHSPVTGEGDGRHRVGVVPTAAAVIAAAASDEPAATACAAAAMGPATGGNDDDDDDATSGGGTPATSWRKAVPAETLRLRNGLSAACRSAAEDKAGRTLAATPADYSRAGLSQPAGSAPAPAASASALRLGLSTGRVDLVGVGPPGSDAVPGIGRAPSSVLVQVCRRGAHYGVDPSKPTVRLSGAGVIHDCILGRRFRISPLAFFQTNTLGACRLYGAVRDAVEGSGVAQALGPPCPALTAGYDVMTGIDPAWELVDRRARHPAAGPGPGVFDRTALAEADAAAAAPGDADAAPATAASAPSAADASLHSAGARPRILLDVFCGSGTIGISLARPGVDAVVGVELSEAAVKDAAVNAAANGLTVLPPTDPAAPALPADARGTATYIASRAETAMLDLFRLAGLEQDVSGSWVLPPSASARFGGVRPAIVAVVDPPRAGIALGVVHALRACPAISRLVYVSCNPFGTFPDNAVR